MIWVPVRDLAVTPQIIIGPPNPIIELLGRGGGGRGYQRYSAQPSGKHAKDTRYGRAGRTGVRSTSLVALTALTRKTLYYVYNYTTHVPALHIHRICEVNELASLHAVGSSWRIPISDLTPIKLNNGLCSNSVHRSNIRLDVIAQLNNVCRACLLSESWVTNSYVNWLLWLWRSIHNLGTLRHEQRDNQSISITTSLARGQHLYMCPRQPQPFRAPCRIIFG